MQKEERPEFHIQMSLCDFSVSFVLDLPGCSSEFCYFESLIFDCFALSGTLEPHVVSLMGGLAA